MAILFGNSDLNTSESLNNPGNLSDLTNDKYAIGKIENLNVYSSPEEGIASLCLTLQSIQIDGAKTVEDIVNAFVDKIGNLTRTRTIYANLRKTDYLTKVNDIWGIGPSEVVNLTDPSTILIFAIVFTELVQDRNIYSYNQFIKGCALAFNIDTSNFENLVNQSTLNIESDKSSGYVSPASSTVAKGGSSLGYSFSSNYQQISPVTSNFSTISNEQETATNINTINYSLRNTVKDIKSTAQITQNNNLIPAALTQLGFLHYIIVNGNLVYVNDAGDKATSLNNLTYVIKYANGNADTVVKAVTNLTSINNEAEKNIGVISNQVTLESQKTKLEKQIAKSVSLPTVTKPLSTAQTILASYRFR